MDVEIINTRAQFVDFARRMGVRPDWHEPDEQDLTARIEPSMFTRVEGTPLDFDNAGFWPTSRVPELPETLRRKGWDRQVELHVIFCEKVIEDGVARRGRDIAAVNLATLCAWASEPCGALAREIDQD